MIKKEAYYSKEIEEAVIGAILYDEKVLPEVASILDPEDFYATNHGLIYRQMINLYKDGQKVDTLTVHEALKEAGNIEKVGGAYFLTGLFEKCPTAANAPDYAKKVFNLAQRRNLLKLGYKLYNGGSEEKAKAIAELKDFDLVPPWERDRKAFEIHSIEALISDQTSAPSQLISRGLLPTQSILLLSGAPKTGKSILALNFGLCLASGQDWFQFKIRKKIKVLIIQSEVVYWALKDRLQKMKLGCESPIPKDSFFVSDPFQCDILTDEGYSTITNSISGTQPNVVLFDPLLSFHSVDENDNSGMAKVMAKFRELTFLGISIVLIHHSRKMSDDSTIFNPRGASAISGAVDSLMELSKDKESVITAKFDLRYDEAPDEIKFKRNPETLWLETYNPELKAKHNSTIVRLLDGSGADGKPLIDLVTSLIEQFDRPERTVRHWITELSKTGIITVSGKGNSKRVFITCNPNQIKLQ